MHYNFLNLDEKIREIMIDEVNQDLSNNNFYESRSMNEFGLTTYPNILKTHFKTGDVNSLAAALSSNMFLSTDSAGRKTRYNINKVVAYNDFNKYYVRAILRLATEDKYLGVEIYRAKYSSKPRKESEHLIGKKYTDKSDIQNILNAFRNKNILYSNKNNFDLLQPNSGLSLKLISKEVQNG